MLVITVVLAVGIPFALHPIGFSVVFGIGNPIIMVISLLRIDAFASPTEAPCGPIQEALLALRKIPRKLFKGTQEQRPGIKRLRFLIGEGSSPLVQADGSNRRLSVVPQASGANDQAPNPGIKQLRFLKGEGSAARLNTSGYFSVRRIAPQPAGASISVEPAAGGLSSFDTVLPTSDVEANTRLPWSSLLMSQREGVSHAFLVAILEAWRIPGDMTIYELSDQHVKPACRKANSGFLDVMMKTACPEGWFGPMNVFVSYWSVSVVGCMREQSGVANAESLFLLLQVGIQSSRPGEPTLSPNHGVRWLLFPV